MLYRETVPQRALELLTQIQSDPFFAGVRLVGGTALALQVGHRVSIDLDFFGELPMDHQIIGLELSKFGNVVNIQNQHNISVFALDGVKVDFVNYYYPWLESPITEMGFTLARKKDIAAMKISAITGRGSKKDFIDLYVLLSYFSLPEIIQFFKEKYPDGSTYLAIKSLFYFEDADPQESPKMLIDLSWKEVKEKIIFEAKKLV